MAGCSSSGTKAPGSSTPASSPTGSTAPSSSTTPGSVVKLGFLLDLTSPVSFGPGSSNVINAWVKFANAHGGVGGHPVEAIITDTKGDPATSKAAVNSLLA